MELVFCSQCGISIPQSEVDAGVATAGEGKFLCSEHRPAPPVGDEPELLFCANCTVSIPQSDVKSGRARREYGSLLCAQCSRADAVERAARRDAVEAEMAADSEVSDPLAMRRCSVCAASVSPSQIASGRARVTGDRVVCERCRAAADVAEARESRAGAGTWLLVVLVILALGLSAYAAAFTWKARTAPAPVDHGSEVAALRAEVTRLTSSLERERSSASAERGEQAQALSTSAAELREAVRSLGESLANQAARSSTADEQMAQRVAKLEGQLAGVVEMVKGLAARSPAPAEAPRQPEPPPVVDPTPEEPRPAPEPPPVVREVDPEVSRNVKDLLESADPGTRYAAVLELTRLADPAAIPALSQALVGDENVMVRRAAARALGNLRAWNAVPALIQALEERESYVAQQANFALLAITGQDFGVNQDQSVRERRQRASAAAKWWEKNREAPPEGVSLEPVRYSK